MRRLCVVTAVLALAGVIARPALAQTPLPDGETAARCTLSLTQYFDPGVGTTPGSGGQSSQGEVGSIICSGRIDGANITGPGTIGNEGRLHDSNCVLDHSTGRYSATLPTDRGLLRIEGTYEIFRTALMFEIRTSRPGPRGSGWGVVVPTKGDCVVNPITEVQVLMTLDFRGDEAAVATCDLNLGVVGVNCRSRS